MSTPRQAVEIIIALYSEHAKVKPTDWQDVYWFITHLYREDKIDYATYLVIGRKVCEEVYEQLRS